MSKNSFDDYLVLGEGLVDISSGKAAPAQSNEEKHSSESGKNPNNKNNKKKSIKILSDEEKLKKKFRKVKREYLKCSRMLFYCKNDLKNMINPELIRQKKEKIARLEIQVEALNRRGAKLLDEIDQIKKYGL